MGDIADYYEEQDIEGSAYESAVQMVYTGANQQLEKYSSKPISIARELITWETKNGRKILVKNLDDKHLANLIRFLRNRSAGEKGQAMRYYNNWIDLLTREQKYRSKDAKK